MFIFITSLILSQVYAIEQKFEVLGFGPEICPPISYFGSYNLNLNETVHFNTTNKLLWTSDNQIFSLDCTSQQNKPVVEMTENLPLNCSTIDERTGIIYYASQTYYGIRYPNGSSQRFNFTEKVNPTYMVVDHENGLLFIATKSSILKININSREITTVYVTNQFMWPSSMALDVKGKTVFWTNAQKHCIWSCPYDGQDCKQILEKLMQPKSVKYVEGNIFWVQLVESHMVVYGASKHSNGTFLKNYVNENVTSSVFLIIPAEKHKGEQILTTPTSQSDNIKVWLPVCIIFPLIIIIIAVALLLKKVLCKRPELFTISYSRASQEGDKAADSSLEAEGSDSKGSQKPSEVAV